MMIYGVAEAEEGMEKCTLKLRRVGHATGTTEV
jgi:hypothetical protein